MTSLIYFTILWMTVFTFTSNAQSVHFDNITDVVGGENRTDVENTSSATVGLLFLNILNEAGLDVHRLMLDCNRNESFRNQTMEELSALNNTFISEELELNDTEAVMERILDVIAGSPFLQDYATPKVVIAKLSSFSQLLVRFGVDYNYLVTVVEQKHDIGKQVLKELSPFNQTTIRDAMKTDKHGLMASELIRNYIEHSALLMSYPLSQRNKASILITVSTIPISILIGIIRW